MGTTYTEKNAVESIKIANGAIIGVNFDSVTILKLIFELSQKSMIYIVSRILLLNQDLPQLRHC